MKSLNLNACGVSEMSAAEMQKVDGGCAIWDGVVGFLTDVWGWIVGHAYTNTSGNGGGFYF